jgi:hypothetical protein
MTTATEPTPIMGYVPRKRFRWIEIPAGLIDVEDGAEPLKVKIRSHLTFGQIDEIPDPLVKGTLFNDIKEAIVDYVLDWNVMAPNAETGELEKVPPPAEAGVDAFLFLAGFEVEWIAASLRTSTLGSLDDLRKEERELRKEGKSLSPEKEARKKGSAPSAATPAQSGAKN